MSNDPWELAKRLRGRCQLTQTQKPHVVRRQYEPKVTHSESSMSQCQDFFENTMVWLMSSYSCKVHVFEPLLCPSPRVSIWHLMFSSVPTETQRVSVEEAAAISPECNTLVVTVAVMLLSLDTMNRRSNITRTFDSVSVRVESWIAVWFLLLYNWFIHYW